MARPISIEVSGQVHRVTVERLEPGEDRFRVSRNGTTVLVDAVAIDGHTLSLVDVDEGTCSRVVRFAETSSPGEIDVHLDGAVVRAGIDRERVRFGDGATAADGGDGVQQVVAPMPGKVIRLLVEVGEDVEARQGVVVVEAMKMENELTAPRAGRVADVRVDEGASVEAGKVLVVIE